MRWQKARDLIVRIYPRKKRGTLVKTLFVGGSIGALRLRSRCIFVEDFQVTDYYSTKEDSEKAYGKSIWICYYT